MSRFLVTGFLFVLVYSLLGQSPYTLHKQFTLEDGLPSNECHDVVQDSLGYIWIATDRGLVRYDGYGFKTYGPGEGLQNISCLALQIDHNNDIWIQTYGFEMYRYLHLNDTIVAYEYNDVIDMEKGNSYFIDFYFSPDQEFYANLHNEGLLKIDKSGNPNFVKKSSDNAEIYILDVFDRSFYCVSDLVKFRSKEEKGNLNTSHIPQIEYVEKIQYKSLRFVGFPDDGITSCSKPFSIIFNKDTTIIRSSGLFHFIENGEHHSTRLDFGTQGLLKVNGAGIITYSLCEEGVKFYNSYEDFKLDLSHPVIEDVTASAVLLDKNENLFVTTLKGGLFYLKKERSIKNIVSDKLINRIIVKDSTIYYLENLNYVKKYDLDSGIDQVIVEGMRCFDFIKDDSLFDLFVCAYPGDVLLMDEDYDSPQSLTGLPFYDTFSSKRVQKLSDEFWILGTHYILTYDFENRKVLFSSFELEKFINVNTIASKIDGNYLLGSRDGVFEFNLDSIKSLSEIHPLFNQRVNDIIPLDGLYYLATLGGGILIWDGQTSVEVLDVEDGLISNNVERLYEKDGIFYACTYSGLSVITFDKGRKVSIENYTTQDGLPSNQIFDVDVVGNTIYAATGRGVVGINSSLSAAKPSKPIIEKVEINNTSYPFPNLESLGYDENNISIEFKALDIDRSADIKYRFKLNDQDWKTSNETKVNFANLSPNEYRFEVKADNAVGDWGDSTLIKFEIHPPWWKSLWFYLVSLVFVGFLFWAYYRSRVKKLKDQAFTAEEMRNLEKSALQAQMNPHFIFNCLNSIQSFIITNEKDLAMDYLSKFASLIRQNLNSSFNQNVSLDAELKMVENYLDLERLRFNNNFHYTIDVQDELDLIDIKIPPLIIQPYVENAVLHGMKGKNGDGVINLNLFKEGQNLVIKIKDDGSGFKTSMNKKNSSLGMSITQRRIALLNNDSSDHYKIETHSTISGTEIKIIIDLSSSR